MTNYVDVELSVHTVSNMFERKKNVQEWLVKAWRRSNFIKNDFKHVETIIFDRQTFFPQTFNLGILGYFDKKKKYFYFGGNLKIVVY